MIRICDVRTFAFHPGCTSGSSQYREPIAFRGLVAIATPRASERAEQCDNIAQSERFGWTQEQSMKARRGRQQRGSGGTSEVQREPSDPTTASAPNAKALRKELEETRCFKVPMGWWGMAHGEEALLFLRRVLWSPPRGSKTTCIPLRSTTSRAFVALLYL